MLTVLNLIVVLVAMSSGALSEAITMKCNAFVIGGFYKFALSYFCFLVEGRLKVEEKV